MPKWILHPVSGELVPADEYVRPHLGPRSHLPMPHFIQDTLLDPVQSMSDGKMYDSKQRLRKAYKEQGMIEVGTEKLPGWKKPKPNREEIRKVVEKNLLRTDI